MRVKIYSWALFVLALIFMVVTLIQTSSKVVGLIIAGVIIFIAWDIKESDDEGNLL